MIQETKNKRGNNLKAKLYLLVNYSDYSTVIKPLYFDLDDRGEYKVTVASASFPATIPLITKGRKANTNVEM